MAGASGTDTRYNVRQRVNGTVQQGGEKQSGHMGVRGVLRCDGLGQLGQLIMPTLMAFVMIFVVSTALNYLVL